MKMLEYSCGFLNLKSNPFFEIIFKMNGKDIFECWLESCGRDIFLFSFEDEKDAKKFRNIFWLALKNFVQDEEKETLNLGFLIHETIDEFLKEEK